MTDRLTPTQLRDLADLIRANVGGSNARIWENSIRCEAARREAEAKELGRDWKEGRVASPNVEREGPRSADAHLKLRDIAPNETVRAVIDKMASEGVVLVPDKPAPAAMRPQEWRDIASAPKDGTPLMLFARAKHATAPVRVVGWYLPSEGRWIECSFTQPVGIVPYYWQPLADFPAAPAPGGGT